MISRSQLSVFQSAPAPPHSVTVAPPIFTGLVLGQAVYAIPEFALSFGEAQKPARILGVDFSQYFIR